MPHLVLQIAFWIVVLQLAGLVVGAFTRKLDDHTDTIVEWVALTIWPIVIVLGLWHLFVVDRWGWFIRFRIATPENIPYHHKTPLIDDGRRFSVGRDDGQERWGWRRIAPGVRIGFWNRDWCNTRSRFLMVGKWGQRRGVSIGKRLNDDSKLAKLWAARPWRGAGAHIRAAWGDAHPIGAWGGYGTGYWRERHALYRFATSVFLRLRRILERGKALRYLARPDEGTDYLGWRARLHAALLLLLPLPIHWHFPEFRKCGWFDEVTSWDGSTWSGAEQTCWEATFIATKRWGLAHIYREGGP